MLTLGGAAVFLLILNLVVSQRTRLIGVALLFVPQFYLPGIRVELATLAILWTLVTCLAGLANRKRSQAGSPLVVLTILFAIVTAVSVLWATPSWVNNGAATAIRAVIFALWLREMIVVGKDDPDLLNAVALWTAPGIAVQSILTIVFRLSPPLESRFLHSKLADFLVGPQSTNLYADWANNVVYPFKAGGLFVNGNIASLFGGISALLMMIAARRSGKHWPYGVALLAVVGSVASGSKTFIFVAAACALAIVFLPHILRGGWALLGALPLVFVLPVAFSLVSELLEAIAPGLYLASNRSYGGREEMWNGGAQLFIESPIFGLGFGGWAERIGRFTGESGVPPHNFIIAAWANSGILAAAIAIIFAITALTICVRVAAAQFSVYDRRTGALAVCAVAWVFIHGMGDNTTIYGEQRTMILIAMVYAYVYTMMPPKAKSTVPKKYGKPPVTGAAVKSLAIAGR